MINLKSVLIIIILFFFAGQNKICSQSNIKLGFNLQAEKLYYRNSSYSGQLNFPTINFLVSYGFPKKNYIAEFNAGYKLPLFDWVLFNGPETGISLSRKILFDWMYAKINFTLHYNKIGGHAAQSGGDGTYTGLFPLIGAGLDLYKSNNFIINLMYVKLLKEKVGYSYSVDGNYHINKFYNLSFFIRVGISFYWSI